MCYKNLAQNRVNAFSLEMHTLLFVIILHRFDKRTVQNLIHRYKMMRNAEN